MTPGLALALAVATGARVPGPAYRACMAAVHAERPQQHCRAQEIARLSRRLPPDAWKAAADARCETLATANRGTLGSIMAQECKLREYGARLRATRGG